MPPLPDQNVRSVLMPAVRLLGKTRKAINHTHDRNSTAKKKPRRLFSETEQRGREAANCFSSLHLCPPPLPLCLFSHLSPTTPSPTPLSSPPTTQTREPTARPNTSQHPNAQNQASHEKKEEGVVSIYSFQKVQQEIAREEKKEDQRGIDVRKTTRDGYIYSNNRSKNTKRTTQNNRLHQLPSLFPVPSPVPSPRPRLPAYTDKEIFSLQKINTVEG